MPKKLNLIGQNFGKLTVISLFGPFKGKTGWNCKCLCGKEKIVKTNDLTSGHVSSCGNHQNDHRKYDKGNKFERLTLVEYENGKWLCLCSCGNYTLVLTTSLSSRNTRSCGCLKTEENLSRINKFKI